MKSRPGLWSFVLQAGSSDEEHFVDVDEPLDDSTAKSQVKRLESEYYEVNSRNPLYCKAETSCLRELTCLESHYHPSVQTFAKKISAVSLR